MRILVAGELNPDAVFVGVHPFPQPGREVLAQGFSLELGSSSAICAAGLAKLGNPVSFVGKVGADFMGRFCLEQLERLNVDATPVIVDPRLKTGVTAAISAADRALVTFSGAIAELCAADIRPELLKTCGHLHVSSYFLQRSLQPGLCELFAQAKGLGLSTSLDTGHDPDERWAVDIASLLANVDVFLPNEAELAGLTRTADIFKGLQSLDNGHTVTVVKLGPRGCATLDSGRAVTIPAIPIEPIDTTGAGDSFDAGFLHARLRGFPPLACAHCGVICGGLSTQGVGGTAGQPDWSAVAERLELAAGIRLS
jgi:sugar/nucleoside kinase (ribokinase family)